MTRRWKVTKTWLTNQDLTIKQAATLFGNLMAESAPPLKLGDWVEHCCGGPVMLVVDIEDEDVTCAWNKGLSEVVYSSEYLERVG